MPDAIPPTFAIRQLRAPAGAVDEDFLKASATLALAFNNDQFTKVITGDDANAYREFLSSTLTASSRCGGHIYVAETHDLKIVGVAIWFGPGHTLRIDSGTKYSDKGAALYTSQFNPDLKRWWDTEFVPKHERLSSAGLGAGVKLKSWNLQIIGTRPDYRRRGVARALMDIVEHKAASGGHPYVMEVQTDVNVGIFKRMGWSVVREPVMFEGWDGVFPMWILKKEASLNGP